MKETGKKTGALLSPREREVLGWLKLGKTSWDISRILGITERTVNYHVNNIIQKLDVSNRVQAVFQATNDDLRQVRDKPARYCSAVESMNGSGELSDILPKKYLEKVFGNEVALEEYKIEDLDKVRKLNPNALFGLAYSIWDRIIKLNLFDVDTAEIGDRISNRDPDMHVGLSDILGTSVIKNLYYAKAGIPAQNSHRTVAEILFALVYPNNLHLKVSLPESDESALDICQDRMKLFLKVIDNALRYGKSHGCNYIMAAASDNKQLGIFGRRGFLLEDRVTEKKAIKLGIGIPMVLQL